MHMLKRKIRPFIYDHLAHRNNKILIIDGARQIGKSYIIRDVAKSLFSNYIEIDFVKDKTGRLSRRPMRRSLVMPWCLSDVTMSRRMAQS